MRSIREALKAIKKNEVEDIIMKHNESLKSIKDGKIYNYRHEAFYNRLPSQNDTSIRRPDLMWIRNEGDFLKFLIFISCCL